jgi:hypothetical protein
VSMFEKRVVRLIKRSNITMAFSCGARSAFNLDEGSYLRDMLSAVICKALLGGNSNICVPTIDFNVVLAAIVRSRIIHGC